jgi:hypothetical protein
LDQLSPEQFEALQSVTDDPAVQARIGLGLAEEEADKFVAAVRDFVKQHAGIPSSVECLFVLTDEASATSALDPGGVRAHVAAGKCCLTVNNKLSLLSAIDGTATFVNCTLRSRGCLAARLTQGGIYWFVDGRLVKWEGPGGRSEPTFSPFIRPFSEIRAIVVEHKEQCLDGERECRYWHDKANRILSGDKHSDGTEAIFQRSLLFWLLQNVRDKLTIYCECQGFGQDKTDVTVVTLSGKNIIEVKWLGTNVGDTSYPEARINEGLVQVGEYLERKVDTPVSGLLVVYDARSRHEHETKSGYDPQKRHVHCDEPMILYLESRTPSQIAATSS